MTEIYSENFPSNQLDFEIVALEEFNKITFRVYLLEGDRRIRVMQFPEPFFTSQDPILDVLKSSTFLDGLVDAKQWIRATDIVSGLKMQDVDLFGEQGNKVELTLLDPNAIQLQTDEHGTFFMIGEYRANLPPQAVARAITGHDVLVFFLEKVDNIGLGIISAYLFEYLRNGKAKEIKVNNQEIEELSAEGITDKLITKDEGQKKSEMKEKKKG